MQHFVGNNSTIFAKNAMSRCCAMRSAEIEPLASSAKIEKHCEVELFHNDSDSNGEEERKSDCARKCIAIILIHAIFLLAILAAFLIGHWLNGDNLLILIANNSSTAEIKSTIPYVTTSTSSSIATPRIIERLIPLKTQRNFSITDVYPPSGFDDVGYSTDTRQLHAIRVNPKSQDVLLVPLPLYVLPYHYEMMLDATKFDTSLRISANLSIHLESFGNSTETELQFHVGRSLSIQRAALKKHRKGKRSLVQELEVTVVESKKLARAKLLKPLSAAKYVLELEYFVRICDDDSRGIRCSLEDQVNSKLRATSFTTKFEPTLARTFFPCWDEPGIKATFNITVRHRSKYTALSNMPAMSSSDGYGVMRTKFQQTPPMSTYLVALAIGDFVKLETRTEHRAVPLTIWSYPEDVMSMKFALHYAPLIFDRLEENLEIPYGLPKIDMIAARNVPVGGMENWGLIVFESTSIAYQPSMNNDYVNETVDRLYAEFRVGKLIAHEIAHQWFGNLVTMRDWSELFLNEGFATFYVYEMMSIERPRISNFEYHDQLYDLFISQSDQDNKLSLVRELATESQVEMSFHPTNLYTKGCVIIKMLRDLVTDFDFKAAVRRYLRKNAYRSVSRDDLFASLPAYADHGADQEKLSNIMEEWLVNEGIPQITITRNYDNGMITVEQRKSIKHDYRVFMRDLTNDLKRRKTREVDDGSTPFDDSLFENFKPTKAEKKRKRKNNVRSRSPPRPIIVKPINRREELRKPRRVGHPADLWHIPVSYQFGSLKTVEGQVIREFWLSNRSVTFNDAEIAPTQYLLANPEWKYPFRVNYDLNNWKLIARTLHQSHDEIPEKSRMQLIIDAEHFLSTSNNPHLYLYLLGYLAHESKLEVMLIGIDAVHRFVDSFKATNLNEPILIYFAPVISQMDRLLAESQVDSETAALWLVRPERLAKLYQLRCAANLPTCRSDFHMSKWSKAPDEWTEDVNKQITAVCQNLIEKSPREIQSLLEERLQQEGAKWILTVQLSACTKNAKLLRKTAKAIVASRNAAVYSTVVQPHFTLHYNRLFRKQLWSEIGKLSVTEKTALFSTNSSQILPASRILIHSIRTIEELQQVRALLPSCGPLISLHFDYLERYLQWIATVSNGVLHQFFSADLASL